MRTKYSEKLIFTWFCSRARTIVTVFAQIYHIVPFSCNILWTVSLLTFNWSDNARMLKRRSHVINTCKWSTFASVLKHSSFRQSSSPYTSWHFQMIFQGFSPVFTSNWITTLAWNANHSFSRSHKKLLYKNTYKTCYGLQTLTGTKRKVPSYEAYVYERCRIISLQVIAKCPKLKPLAWLSSVL